MEDLLTNIVKNTEQNLNEMKVGNHGKMCFKVTFSNKRRYIYI